MNKYEIEKEAQSRSILKGVGRALNPLQQLRYWGFSDYREVYDAISKVDKDIRKKALRAKPNAREAIHQARIAYKRREFPKVIYYSMKVMDSITGVFEDVSKLDKIKQKMLDKLYGKKGLSEKQLQEMHEGLGQKAEEKKAAAHIQSLLYTTATPEHWEINKEVILRQAGPVQWFKEQLPSWQGMKFDIVDSIFQNQAAKQKEAARDALDIAEDSYKKIVDIFSELENNLDNFAEYVRIANEAKDSMSDSRKQLQAIYKENFAHIVPGKKEPEMPTAETQPAAPVPAAETSAPVPAPAATPTQPVAGQSTMRETVQVPRAEPPDGDGSSFAVELDLSDQPPAQQTAEPQPAAAQPAAAQPAVAPAPSRKGRKKEADYDILELIKKAQYAVESNENGLAVALLVQASEICDSVDKEEQAIDLLRVAQEISRK